MLFPTCLSAPSCSRHLVPTVPKARFSRVPLANGETQFDKDTVQMMLPKSFDPRIDDHSGFPSSSTTCYQAPNRIRNQRSCMSCWAFASATVFTDRQCLAVLKEHLSNHPDGNGAPPPLLYSPASALACRKPPTCLLGGFTNFVTGSRVKLSAGVGGLYLPMTWRESWGREWDMVIGQAEKCGRTCMTVGIGG